MNAPINKEECEMEPTEFDPELWDVNEIINGLPISGATEKELLSLRAYNRQPLETIWDKLTMAAREDIEDSYQREKNAFH